MTQLLSDIVNTKKYKLHNNAFRSECNKTLNKHGVLVLKNFLTPLAIAAVQREGRDNQHLAYYTTDDHNLYLKPSDPEYPENHPRNRKIQSSKGCITTDQIPKDSPLHLLYGASEFRSFLCAVLGESELFEYADTLSSVNLHYASEGQELGWHYDNSSFAITLLVQNPEQGGEFEYVKDVRNADIGEMNFEMSEKILDGDMPTTTLSMDPGSLVLFRGRNSMHRVTPVQGARTRMLVVLAYNTQPGISLSQSARMTFYGRLG